MDLQKGKRLLNKINALYSGMEADKDGIAAIEKDLMRSYIRQFYDVFLEAGSVSAPSPPPVRRKPTPPPAAPAPPPPPTLKPRIIELSEEVKDFVEEVRQPDPVPAPPPVRAAAPSPAPPVAPTPAPITVQPAPPPPAPNPPRPAPPVVDLAGNEEVAELFHEKQATDLSEKLSSMPVNDLMKTMGLNERILTVNELFGGDANAFKNVMTDLNRLGNFEEAKQYLAANVVEKYGWTKRNKKSKAKVLIKTIRRRYA